MSSSFTFADVALPINFSEALTYQIPKGFHLFIGQRVTVPFRGKTCVGVVVALHSRKSNFECKSIIKILEPLFSTQYCEWLGWAQNYYFSSLNEVWQSALPPALWDEKSIADLGKHKSRKEIFGDHWSLNKKVELTPDQQVVLDTVLRNGEQFKAFLLHGITGSGKTEIYIRLIEYWMSIGKQTILLVPEIGLTPQIVSRFREVFGDTLGLYHSGLTNNQRLKEWLKIKSGETKILVGTRSALFAPFENLGGIIIDEEHDGSYKQEEGFKYHARDLAIVRAQKEGFPILMGSATPSLESYSNAISKKYQLLELKNRIGELPQIEIINMSAMKRQKSSPLVLTEPLHQAIADTLSKNEQVMILINRRGFAAISFCLNCQQASLCVNCSVSLTYHKNSKNLCCHYCNYKTSLPKKCPHCASQQLTLLGSGTETVEEELKTFFPKAVIGRLDRDSTQKAGVLLKTLKAFKKGEIDILIGTQMIAKGHDNDRVTLVGIVGIDSSLNVPDFRAAEKTFQLVTQVAGRSGRGGLKGKVMIQAFASTHDSIVYAQSGRLDEFYKKELAVRQELHYPPHGRLVQIRFSASDESVLARYMRQLEQWLENEIKSSLSDVALLGPTPAMMLKIKSRFRWQLLIKAKTSKLVHGAARKVFEFKKINPDAKVKWAVDVDPVSMI